MKATLDTNKLQRQLELIEQINSVDMYNLGDKFFESVACKLREVLNADYAFVGKLTECKSKIETISLTNRHGVIDNFLYELRGTPCENVIGEAPCVYPKGVADLFPEDQLLLDMGIEGYVGVPLYDSKLQPTGIIVCLYENEITETFALESILMIFASRASAELEHMKLYSQLARNREELSRKVQERTAELSSKNQELQSINNRLSNTLQNLQSTQSQLIQSEKMASLGILVSGVAHEINNPLNYIKGGSTALSDYFNKFGSEDETTDIIIESINDGVARISKICQGLNQFSRVSENMDEDCEINTILDNCLAMVGGQAKRKVKLIKNYHSEQIVLKGNSGKLHQVFLNIIANGIQAIEGTGEVSVNTNIRDENVLVEIQDTGKGIDEAIKDKIVDPFFTTKAPGKGTGLGLSISLSIIKQHKGKLNIESELNAGTKMTISLPLN